MFQLPTFKLPLFGARAQNYPTIDLPSVEIHDVETSTERRARTLKHLLKANHVNHSIIYHDLRFHNHAPHILGSAYLLGGTHEHLQEIYEKEAEELEPWHDAPGEISQEDWRDYLGRREYQRAFVDFLEDQLVQKRYEWREVLEEFLYGGKKPLINGVLSGLAHPLIHLGYAYELNSRTVAIEAVAMAACFYDPSPSGLHKYIDDAIYTRPSPHTSTSLLNILEKVRNDKRFDGLYDHRSGDISKVLSKREDAFLEYWNAWDLSSDPRAQFEVSQKTAVAMLLGTEPPKAGEDRFDFFLVHVLTSSHAVRILLPCVPAKFHMSLVRQWWLFALAVYIAQMRPVIDESKVTDFDLEGRDWKFVVDKALRGKHGMDAHYVKALRAMKVGAETWGGEGQFYLRGAVQFAGEFGGWGGFGPMEEEGKKYGYPERQ